MQQTGLSDLVVCEMQSVNFAANGDGGGADLPEEIFINLVMQYAPPYPGLPLTRSSHFTCRWPKSFSDLKIPEHVGSRGVGITIFKTLVQCIRPRILVLHDAKVRNELRKELKTQLPKFPMDGGKLVQPNTPIQKEIEIGERRSVMFPIPSLALPASNTWSSWAEIYLTMVGNLVKDILSQ